MFGVDKEGNNENIGDRECQVVPVSALSGDGIEDAMKWLIKALKNNFRPPVRR